MTIIRTGILQMRSGIDPGENFTRAEILIREAVAKGATFVATPENTGLMQMDRLLMLQQIHRQADDPVLARFCQLAKTLDISLLIGSLAVRVTKDKAANRSFLIGPDGNITARYDKIHLFDVAVNASETWRESDHIQGGDKAVLADLGVAKVGLSICYDLRFADLYRKLALSGAHILAVPAAFTRVTGKAHWQTLLRARAIENACYVIAPAQGGVHEDGRKTWGHSMIIDPWGKVIAAFDHDNPGLLVADIDLQQVIKTRSRIPVLSQIQAFTGP